jgi:hypothetical protein
MNISNWHTMEFVVIFLFCFVLVAFGYAFLSSFTRLFYRNRRKAELSYVENLIKEGGASFGQRITLFWASVFGSLVVPYCYLLAAVLTGLYLYIYL